jgi:hypothetical protein
MRMILIAALPMLMAVGCATNPSINYAPSSILTAQGNVDVCDFTYQPAIKGKVKPNQIRNIALGAIYFEQNIDQVLRDATFKELRFVGVKTQSDKKFLQGNIIDFLIDDLGYSIDWTLQIEYRVADKQTNKELYKSTKTLKKRTSKFSNVFGSLNEIIKLNIEELIKDPDFIKAIN